MSQGLRLPMPFPQYVGSPPKYKTANTYTVLYGQIINLRVDNTRSVVGTDQIQGGIAVPFGRAPAVSHMKPADPYIILDGARKVPKDPYNRPMPVRYGDRITLMNTLTNEFWQVSKGTLLGSGNRFPPAVFTITSNTATPPKSALSGYIAGTVPFSFPQPNSFVLESVYGPISMISPQGLGISVPGVGVSFSAVLTSPPPYPVMPSSTEITWVSNAPFEKNPHFYFPTEGHVSPVFPSRLSLNKPPSPVYSGPLPPN